jgi:NADH dehydrogenase FAD-containing subunit
VSAVTSGRYDRPVKPRILVLGAGFGGLELATIASQELGDDVDLTVIDGAGAFVSATRSST